jgi:hypothetical protein
LFIDLYSFLFYRAKKVASQGNKDRKIIWRALVKADTRIPQPAVREEALRFKSTEAQFKAELPR